MTTKQCGRPSFVTSSVCVEGFLANEEPDLLLCLATKRAKLISMANFYFLPIHGA